MCTVYLPHVEIEHIPRCSVAPVSKQYLFGRPVHVKLTNGSIDLDLWRRSDYAAPAAAAAPALDASWAPGTGAMAGRDESCTDESYMPGRDGSDASDEALATPTVFAGSPIQILKCKSLHIGADGCPSVFKNLEYLIVDFLETRDVTNPHHPLRQQLQQQLPSLKAVIFGRSGEHTFLTRSTACTRADERDAAAVVEQALSASMFQYVASLE